MILGQFTSYVLVCQSDDFTIYDTHLIKNRNVDALRAEKQNG